MITLELGSHTPAWRGLRRPSRVSEGGRGPGRRLAPTYENGSQHHPSTSKFTQMDVPLVPCRVQGGPWGACLACLLLPSQSVAEAC